MGLVCGVLGCRAVTFAVIAPGTPVPPSGFIVNQPVAGTCLRGRGMPGCDVFSHCSGVAGAAVRFHRQSGRLKQAPAGELPRGPQNLARRRCVGCLLSVGLACAVASRGVAARPQEPCMCLVLHVVGVSVVLCLSDWPAQSPVGDLSRSPPKPNKNNSCDKIGNTISNQMPQLRVTKLVTKKQ